MHSLIAKMLSRLAIEPRIDVVFPDGSLQSIGQGAVPRLRMRIVDGPTELKLALNPELALGEAVMDGRVVVEQGSLYDLLDAVVAAMHKARPQGWGKVLTGLRTAVRRFHQHNTPALAKRNVAHHYDLKSDFFRLFRGARRRTGRGAARQEAAHHSEARCAAGPARARCRLRLGRHGLVDRR